MAERGLGRGLLSVFGEESVRAADGNQALIPIDKIEPNTAQPRHVFDEQALQQLADSIKKHGLITPIAVRAAEDGNYMIIAGERRWRACKIAGINDVPAIIMDADDKAVLELALIENLQRENLNPFEEAQGYKDLMDDFGMTQEEVSERVGRSRSTVANILRILTLPDSIKEMVQADSISIGHARALLPLANEQEMLDLAQIICNENLSVRQTEMIVKKKMGEQDKSKDDEPAKKNTVVDYAEELAKSLSERMGRKVVVKSGKNKGKITLEYYSLDDLERLTQFLESGNFSEQSGNE